MKGLRKYLTPFAPDQSGAVSMCYALGGMVVIVDAGGCAGNICGFDEPRWQPDYLTGDADESEDGVSSGQTVPRVGAVFSAALRDMDAILGRDDFLIRKVEDTSKMIDIKFIALIGTPVPAVIGTDLEALSRMAQRKTGLPCIAVSADGMHMYDRGIEDALLALVKTFSSKSCTPSDGVCGVLGLNPLDLFDPIWIDAVRTSLLKKGYREVLLHTMDGGIDSLKRAGTAAMNYVVSPAGLAAARYLEEHFHTPYEVAFPADPMILLEENLFHEPPRLMDEEPYRNILIVHQQVLANSIRTCLREHGMQGQITAATWFDKRPELSEEGDVKLAEEDDFTSLVKEHEWDLIIADPSLRVMADEYKGRWVDAYHFAVSGQAAIRNNREKRAGGGAVCSHDEVHDSSAAGINEG